MEQCSRLPEPTLPSSEPQHFQRVSRRVAGVIPNLVRCNTLASQFFYCWFVSDRVHEAARTALGEGDVWCVFLRPPPRTIAPYVACTSVSGNRGVCLPSAPLFSQGPGARRSCQDRFLAPSRRNVIRTSGGALDAFALCARRNNC